MSVTIATMGKYWQPAIPDGGPGGYTLGKDFLYPQREKRLKVDVKLVNICEDKDLEITISAPKAV